MGLLDSPREHAEHISEGKEEPHHLGKKTNAVLQQEFYQLMINFNPNLSKTEKEKYESKVKENIQELEKLGILSSIMNKYGSHIEREFNALINKFRWAQFQTLKEFSQ